MPLLIVRENIVNMQVDAIVTTTNEKMIGYSGVDLEVHTAAGQELDVECQRLAPLELGFAKITKGYKLGCKYIIHTAGPVWRGGGFGERALLKSCYTESLRLAKEHKCKSVAFPLICSGAYGYPKDRVLRNAVQIISEFLYKNEMTVYLCVFDKQSYELSRELSDDLKRYLNSPADKNTEACPRSSTGSHFRSMPVFGMVTSNSVFDFSKAPDNSADDRPASPISSKRSKKKADNLNDYLEKMDKGFSDTLFDYIDESGITDTECYKKANIDRRTFSKIRSNSSYRPSKATAVAFAIALELDLESTQHLLSTAGMTLSGSSIFDKIIIYFIQNEIFDVFQINEALFEYDQITLGCQVMLSPATPIVLSD